MIDRGGFEDIFEIFHIADEIQKGIYLLGGQSILFPTETLDKKEKLEDVCGYLNNWAELGGAALLAGQGREKCPLCLPSM